MCCGAKPKDRKQARVILGYIHKTLHAVPQLKDMIEREGVEEIELTNKLAIEATTANIGSSRGRMVVAALCDEIAFWATDEDSASPDEDVLNALRPGMATIPNAMLLVASSPVCEARRVVEHLQAVRRCSGVHIGRYLENQAPDKEHIRFIRLKKFSDRL